MLQFNASANGGQSDCPDLTGDGGVGIMQLTRLGESEALCGHRSTWQPPTDDQFWDWTTNVNGGGEVLLEKYAIANGYPEEVRNSPKFIQMQAATIKYYNAHRKPGQPPLQNIVLPDFISGDFNNPQEAELDAIRGYNGWCGCDELFGPTLKQRFRLHEYRVAVDATTGLLSITVPPGGTTGTARWERITAAERLRLAPTCPNPDYVDLVLNRDPTTCNFIK